MIQPSSNLDPATIARLKSDPEALRQYYDSLTPEQRDAFTGGSPSTTVGDDGTAFVSMGAPPQPPAPLNLASPSSSPGDPTLGVGSPPGGQSEIPNFSQFVPPENMAPDQTAMGGPAPKGGGGLPSAALYGNPAGALAQALVPNFFGMVPPENRAGYQAAISGTIPLASQAQAAPAPSAPSPQPSTPDFEQFVPPENRVPSAPQITSGFHPVDMLRAGLASALETSGQQFAGLFRTLSPDMDEMEGMGQVDPKAMQGFIDDSNLGARTGANAIGAGTRQASEAIDVPNDTSWLTTALRGLGSFAPSLGEYAMNPALGVAGAAYGGGESAAEGVPEDQQRNAFLSGFGTSAALNAALMGTSALAGPAVARAVPSNWSPLAKAIAASLAPAAINEGVAGAQAAAAAQRDQRLHEAMRAMFQPGTVATSAAMGLMGGFSGLREAMQRLREGGLLSTAPEGTETRIPRPATKELYENPFSIEKSGGHIDKYVKGIAPSEVIQTLREMGKNNQHLQFEGKPLKIKTSAREDVYNAGRHTIYLTAAENAVPRGTLAEELQHALDRITGVTTRNKLIKFRNSVPQETALALWHVGVWTRMANALEGNQPSFLMYILTPEDIPAIRQVVRDTKAEISGIKPKQ